jgi:hypothetical protein
MHNSEIERLYGRLSEDGKEAADYIGEMGQKVHTLSEDEERYAFGCAVAALERLSVEDRTLVVAISRLRAQMYDARLGEFLL